VAEQHDIDESDQFPKEDLAGKAEDNGAGVEEGHRNGDGDQGHHARPPLAEFAGQPLEERPAAVEEDDGGKDEENVGIAGEDQGLLQAQELLNQRRQGQHWHRQDCRDPEPAPEFGDHGRVIVPCVSMRRVLAGQGSGMCGCLVGCGGAHRGLSSFSRDPKPAKRAGFAVNF
jgi:hypothetical protein